jgi:virginiamycin B lyase
MFITAGPDQTMWFTLQGTLIGHITMQGVSSTFNLGESGMNLVAGPDNNVWMAAGSDLIRATTTGTATRFGVFSEPLGIAAGADGNLWYTGTFLGGIGSFTP